MILKNTKSMRKITQTYAVASDLNKSRKARANEGARRICTLSVGIHAWEGLFALVQICWTNNSHNCQYHTMTHQTDARIGWYSALASQRFRRTDIKLLTVTWHMGKGNIYSNGVDRINKLGESGLLRYVLVTGQNVPRQRDPTPSNPPLHIQSNPPSVLLQVAWFWQAFGSSSHSTMSAKQYMRLV